MRAICHRPAIFAFLCLSFLASSTFAASVLAIDYGADFIKASLMKPGVPFDVLLNKDSKRKIQSSVAWKKGDRLFGQDAFNLAARFPEDTYNSMKYLLGAPANADIVSYYSTIATSPLVATTRYTAGVPRPGGKTWDVEELVAMQLAYVKQLAEDAAGERVQDVIIAVPPFFSQFERDAVADAVEIAGLRLLALINDGTAIAINYAMTRTFTEPERHIIYDSGAKSTRATVVTFSPQGKGTQIAVNGIGYDRIVGGTELDRRLREILIADFQRKYGRDIRQDKKAMARLWKEAGRVKGILSANTEATATIESLVDEIDFKAKVSRSAFEAQCADIQERFAQPIYDALHNANLTLGDIKSVILAGGSSRVPMVRAALNAAVGEDKIAVNVNADEAAVLGAALHGAGLSRAFRTKDIKVTDIAPYNIQVSYLAEVKTDGPGVRPRTITSTAFAAGTKTGTRKTLSFKRRDDFSLQFAYTQPPASGFPVSLIDVRISGVQEALANITEEGGVEPMIKATIMFSESGFVSVPEAVAYADIKDESIAGKLKGLFGDKATDSASESSSTADGTSSSADPKPTKSVTKNSVTIPLKVEVKFPSVAPMSVEHKREARLRLIEMEAQEAAVAQREEQRNGLEGYIYRMRDLLEGDGQQPFMKCSQDHERKTIARKLAEVEEWFHREQDHAQTKDLIEKRSALESLEFPIKHRYKEIEDFPAALNNSQKWNFHTRMFLGEAKTNLTEEEKTGAAGKYTREELDALEKDLKEHEVWLNEKVEKQKLVKMNEDPAVETKDLMEKATKLEMHLQKLALKKPPKVKKSSSGSSAGASSTEGAKGSASPSPSAKGHPTDEL
ncbi:actin-like ATPase domain-containing protein [Amylostereum chailletii]|nr:actin-like ATPase domain-containing protein [Amylostereum chailletii]